MSIHQRTKSLSSRGDALADTFFQLKVLNGKERSELQLPSFQSQVEHAGFPHFRPSRIETLQINIGKLCNQSCAHCHVDAGPDKKLENMSLDTLKICLDILSRYDIQTVDITGGAPEMNPHFRWFVQECRKLGKTVIDRCNLTIVQSNKKYRDLPEWFAAHQVQIVSSLPHFNKVRTDAQRGDGVFEDSIKTLLELNAVGYGMEDTGLILDLVFNPSGAFLPSGQAGLEREFKAQLKRKHNIVFNRLFAITNMPISRFLDYLLESDNFESYMTELVNAFNPAAVSGVMCRNTLSVGWDGYLYDCDFNQMLGLKVKNPAPQHISQFDLEQLTAREIVLNQHCFGCTAGAGSSCGGEVLT